MQYNLGKVGVFFAPDGVTSQNRNYLVCSSCIRNIFRDLINITNPYAYESIIYPKERLGNPEVIAYSYINNQNKPMLLLYSEKEKNNKNMTEFSIKDIIGSVKVGNILSHTWHQFLIYELKKYYEENVIDALSLESNFGKGKAYIKTKIASQTLTLNDGTIMPRFLSFLYHNSKLNSNFEESRVEGTIGFYRLSTNGIWINMNNINTRNAEY